MTNRIAIVLFSFIFLLLLCDAIFNGLDGTLFLAQKFNWFIDWLAFWR